MDFVKMNINENVIRKIKLQIASRLLKAGHMLASGLKAQLSKSFPPASKAGQFPRYRTGAGRDAVAVVPTSPSQVVALGLKVRVGFRKMANFDYMPYLELEKRRLGLIYQYKQMKPILQAMISGRAA